MLIKFIVNACHIADPYLLLISLPGDTSRTSWWTYGTHYDPTRPYTRCSPRPALAHLPMAGSHHWSHCLLQDACNLLSSLHPTEPNKLLPSLFSWITINITYPDWDICSRWKLLLSNVREYQATSATATANKSINGCTCLKSITRWRHRKGRKNRRDTKGRNYMSFFYLTSLFASFSRIRISFPFLSTQNKCFLPR